MLIKLFIYALLFGLVTKTNSERNQYILFIAFIYTIECYEAWPS